MRVEFLCEIEFVQEREGMNLMLDFQQQWEFRQE